MTANSDRELENYITFHLDNKEAIKETTCQAMLVAGVLADRAQIRAVKSYAAALVLGVAIITGLAVAPHIVAPAALIYGGPILETISLGAGFYNTVQKNEYRRQSVEFRRQFSLRV